MRSKTTFLLVVCIIASSLSTSAFALSRKKAIASPRTYSQAQLLRLADNKYSDGELPLGDGKYVTSGPKKGSIYLCNARTGEDGGAQKAGPWIDTENKTWNLLEKISIQGSVSWPDAEFTNTSSGTTRVLAGNGLSIDHATGTFPVGASDPAYQYDRNPNTISATNIALSLPTNPTYLSTPQCIGGEVGVMLTGVPLYNGFDATLRDAVANEIQDTCEGHPQKDGHYHYHGQSDCKKKNISVKTVIGYALDGFPITGDMVATNKYLTTEDLDECHGIKSQITIDGKNKTMYHYVLTKDFPYSVSCFRGKVTQKQVSTQNSGNQNGQNTQSDQPSGMSQGRPSTPPPEASAACVNKTTGTACSFQGMQGLVSGMCGTPPAGGSSSTALVCMPTVVGGQR
jgi:hypothetical protein